MLIRPSSRRYPASPSAIDATESSRYQFRLRALFSWIGAFAVFLAAGCALEAYLVGRVIGAFLMLIIGPSLYGVIGYAVARRSGMKVGAIIGFFATFIMLVDIYAIEMRTLKSNAATNLLAPSSATQSASDSSAK